MSKKQSSVEWLVRTLNDKIDFIPMNKWDMIRDIVQQAKAMHREEIIETWYESRLLSDYISSNQYYNKTFRGQDNE